MARLRILDNGQLDNFEELCCCNSFTAMIYPCEKHSFDTTELTQPGLAMSPRELLNRVECGLVDVNAVFKGLDNDDNDTDTYPDEVVDLCSAGELIKNGTEYLEQRKKQLEAEKAELEARLTPQNAGEDSTKALNDVK